MKRVLAGMNLFSKLFWLFPCVIVITMLIGIPFVLVQQDLRQSANDPQIQMSEDIARRLSAGKAVSAIAFPDSVDMSRDLGVFVSIYDQNGQPVASTAYLGTQLPKVPLGVLLYAKSRGQNRVTWQPQPGARAAIVATPYKNNTSEGYVVVGRSLREVERLVDQLQLIAELSWLALLCLISVLFLLWPGPMKKTR